MVYVFTGEGKGKTSAAIGVAVRAAGHGKNVLIIQFMKEDAPTAGEIKTLESIENIQIHRFGKSLINNRELFEESTKDSIRSGLVFAARSVKENNIDVLVLDEINVAVSLGLVDAQEVMNLIDIFGDDIDIILTGRNAPREFIERADLVTEMKNIKHPYDKGIKAKKGIDY